MFLSGGDADETADGGETVGDAMIGLAKRCGRERRRFVGPNQGYGSLNQGNLSVHGATPPAQVFSTFACALQALLLCQVADIGKLLPMLPHCYFASLTNCHMIAHLPPSAK